MVVVVVVMGVAVDSKCPEEPEKCFPECQGP